MFFKHFFIFIVIGAVWIICLWINLFAIRLFEDKNLVSSTNKISSSCSIKWPLNISLEMHKIELTLDKLSYFRWYYVCDTISSSAAVCTLSATMHMYIGVWAEYESIVLQWSGWLGFNHRSNHTKDSKNGTWGRFA